VFQFLYHYISVSQVFQSKSFNSIECSFSLRGIGAAKDPCLGSIRSGMPYMCRKHQGDSLQSSREEFKFNPHVIFLPVSCQHDFFTLMRR